MFHVRSRFRVMILVKKVNNRFNFTPFFPEIQVGGWAFCLGNPDRRGGGSWASGNSGERGG